MCKVGIESMLLVCEYQKFLACSTLARLSLHVNSLTHQIETGSTPIPASCEFHVTKPCPYLCEGLFLPGVESTTTSGTQGEETRDRSAIS